MPHFWHPLMSWLSWHNMVITLGDCMGASCLAYWVGGTNTCLSPPISSWVLLARCTSLAGDTPKYIKVFVLDGADEMLSYAVKDTSMIYSKSSVVSLLLSATTLSDVLKVPEKFGFLSRRKNWPWRVSAISINVEGEKCKLVTPWLLWNTITQAVIFINTRRKLDCSLRRCMAGSS